MFHHHRGVDAIDGLGAPVLEIPLHVKGIVCLGARLQLALLLELLENLGQRNVIDREKRTF